MISRSAASASVSAGVPDVKIAAEVLQHHERHPGRAAKPAIGELDPRRLDDCVSAVLWLPCAVTVMSRVP
jgi:hypothetical protein